jgi:hypothetical protein
MKWAATLTIYVVPISLEGWIDAVTFLAETMPPK